MPGQIVTTACAISNEPWPAPPLAWSCLVVNKSFRTRKCCLQIRSADCVQWTRMLKLKAASCAWHFALLCITKTGAGDKKTPPTHNNQPRRRHPYDLLTVFHDNVDYIHGSIYHQCPCTCLQALRIPIPHSPQQSCHVKLVEWSFKPVVSSNKFCSNGRLH